MPLRAREINTKLKMGRNFIHQYTFTDPNANFSRERIMTIIKTIQQKYKAKGKHIRLQVSMPTSFGQTRSAKAFRENEEPVLVEDYEWENGNNVSFFNLFVWEVPQNNTFGSNENNDCLFKCLAEIYGVYSFPPFLKTDEQLKQKLRLKVRDKIPLTKIPEVEKLFKININIQDIYTSTSKYNKTIFLKSDDDHLTIIDNNGKNDKNSSLLKNITTRKQKPILIQEKKDCVITYNGVEVLEYCYDDYYKLNQDFNGDFVYIRTPLVETDDIIYDYNILIEENEKLKTATLGKINLEYSGWKIPNLVQKLIFKSHLGFNEPESLTPKEQEWINQAFMGGLIRHWADDKIYENAYHYDINSCYPSIISDQHFTFPVSQGTFKIIEELENIIPFGIYRCIIDAPFGSSFKTNPKNKYSHIELNLAREKNLNITLIQDGEANALLYSSGRANGSSYFKNVVDSLYDLKTRKFKLAKIILNTMWGALCSRNKIKKSTFSGELHLDESDNPVSIIEVNSKNHKIEYVKEGKYFKHNYARLGVFLTAKARCNLASIIDKYPDQILRCHTDSITSLVPLDVPISEKLGEWKLEGEGRCIIKKGRKIVFLDENP